LGLLKKLKASLGAWASREKVTLQRDNERVTKAVAYLEESATSNCPSSFNNNKEVCCHCLASLGTIEDYRDAVAIHIVLWWARLDKETQQALITEKIKVGKLLNGVVGDTKVSLLPFTTEILEIAEILEGIKICKNALMAVFRIGQGFWKNCERAAVMGTAPKHGLEGKENVRSKAIKQEIEPQLAEFFKDNQLDLQGKQATTWKYTTKTMFKSWIQSGPSSVFIQNTVGIWGIMSKVTLKETYR
jgi:hypothetical protein